MRRRADAERNYQAIIVAAEQVFQTESPQASLQLVADAAQVGRGTLYRHFSDRVTLVAAVFAARLARYEAYIEKHPDDPRILISVLHLVAQDQMTIPGLFRMVQLEAKSSEPIAESWQRTREIFLTLLKTSQAAGVVRPELGLDDVFLVVAMLYGVANSPSATRLGNKTMQRTLSLIEKILLVEKP